MTSEQKIQVLIVDDIPETRENIRKLLQFENDINVIGLARTGHEGIELAKELKPDVILMDINMPDIDGITATEEIKRQVPASQIVILSVQSDPNYMRRAMLAGARDYLTKPPTVDELISAIRRAGVMAQAEIAKTSQPIPKQKIVSGSNSYTSGMMSYGKIITVYSPKGGTGCTTLATNIAVTLNNDDTSVLLVDSNLQFGDVAIFLNEQGKFSVIDLTSRADELDPEVVDSVLIKHSKSGVKILAAPYRPEHAENVTAEEFTKILRYLRQLYSYVIVDTSSTLTDVTLAAIDASDVVILITTQDIPAIKNARLFLDVSEALGIEQQRLLFVMNRYDKRIGITPEKVSENFKQSISAVIPLEDRIVVPSVNRGLPFMLGDMSKPVAKALLSLVEAIRERLAEISEQQEPELAIRNIGG
jgi:pilus assembly protein CpaE